MENKGRIELHCHSGFGGRAALHPGEIIRYLSEIGMPAFAITDESTILSYPELEQVWSIGKYTAKPIYGMEMIVSDNDYIYHLSVLIKNESGKQALYKMISENKSNEQYPVFDLDVLLRNREGLLIGTGTDKGRLYTMIFEGGEDNAIINELSKYDYVEVLPFDKYEAANKKIITLCDELNIPVVAVCDARYTNKIGRESILILKHVNGEEDELPDNHFWSTNEMIEAFSYLSDEKVMEIVIDNTHMIAGMCEPISVCPKDRHYPIMKDAGEILHNLCMKALEIKYPNCRQEAKERLEWELDALKKTGMESYVLQMKELLELSQLKSSEVSLRGTSGGTIVNYLIGLSEIDPLKYKLSPETNYGFFKDREINIEINIPTKIRSEVVQKVKIVNGIAKTVFCGSIQLIPPSLAEEMINEYGMSKECFFDDEIKEKLKWCISSNFYKRFFHPSGIIAIPDECVFEEIMPLSVDSGEIETTYFDYHDTDSFFIKYNLLTHDSLEMLIELAERTGIAIETVPVDSKEVLHLFEVDDNGQVIGCADLPEFQSEYVQNVICLLKPRDFDDMVKILSIIHGTGSWDGNAEKLVKDNGLGIKEIIANRDDVFEYILALGIDRKTAFEISEAVRKGIVSRGRNVKWQNWKRQLIDAGASDWFVWSCEQIRYLFPRAHAISYLIMTMRLGWYKLHYPDDFDTVMKKYKKNHI